MNNKEKIDFIRGKCIEVNNSIVDLVFGCRVEFKFNGAIQVSPLIQECNVMDDDGDENDGYSVLFDNEPWEISIQDYHKIIGRECRLADVLLAIDKNRFDNSKKGAWQIDSMGSFWWTDGREIQNIAIYWKEWGLSSSTEGYKVVWNLKEDNLELQSPETIDFIATLLGYKGDVE